MFEENNESKHQKPKGSHLKITKRKTSKDQSNSLPPIEPNTTDENGKNMCSRSRMKKEKFTDEDLEKFRRDPTHNPKTGRRISENGHIYKQLKKELDKVNLDKSMEEDQLQNIPPKVIIKKLRAKGLATNERK